MKKITKILIILFSIIILYFWSLAFLRLNPNIEIVTKLECLPKFNYENNNGIKILKFDSCEPYKAWKFHWKSLKKEIGEMVSFLKNDMLLWGKDKYLGYPIYSILQNKAKKFIKYIPQENLEEMQGIADWADVNFNDILLINTYDDMLQIAGCSSMLVPKKDNFNDYFIHTRNLDYPIKILAKHKIVLKYNSHISVWFPWYIWVLTWIWKNWISLSNHTAYSINKWEYWIPSWLLYRKILINSGNIEDAKNILEKNKRTIANNLMIWYFKNNTWIIAEFDAKNIDYRNFQKKEILVSTNHFRTEILKKVSTSWEGSRYNQYFEKIWEIKKVDNKEIENILSHYKKSRYWSTIANNGTIQSVIMIPELKKIFVANWKNIPVTNGEYVEINYKF